MISRAFAEVLAAGRSGFNHRVREAQRIFPAFRGDDFLCFLEQGVDGIAVAVEQFDRSRLPAVVLAAYDVALELVGRSLAGPAARGPLLTDAWRSLFPRLARLIAAHPAPVLGMLSNAIVRLEGTAGARVGQWCEEMAALAPYIESAGQLRGAGQVLAWRAGAAHFRAGAFAAAAALPEALALRAFGAAGWNAWQAFRDEVEPDPWWGAGDAHASRARRAGSFSGFGGQFAVPPEVHAAHDAFYVKSADRYFVLIADAYGAVLQPADAGEFAHAAALQSRSDHAVREGALLVGARRIALDLPEDGLAVCVTGTTIAVTSPYTHAIHLIARGEP